MKFGRIARTYTHMKVHIVLKESAREKVNEKTPSSLKRYLSDMKLSNVNVDRIRRHGIITGDIEDPTLLEALKRKRDVEAVEVDSIQKAI